MKKIVFLMVSAFIFLSTAGLIYGQNANNVTVYVNGLKLDTKAGDPPAMIVSSRTMMPFTAFLEAVGSDIKWEPTTMTATAKKAGTEIVVSINSNIAFVNGEPKTLEVPPQIIMNRTMIPISFIALELGYEVSWDPSTYTAYIGSNKVNIAPAKDTGEKNTKITGTFAMQNLQRQNYVVQFNSNMKVDIMNISTNKSGTGTFSIEGNNVRIDSEILQGSYVLEDIQNEGRNYIMLTSNDGSDILALQSITYENFVSGYTSNS